MKWIIAAVIAVIVLFAIMIFNRLVRQRNMVREGWSGIDVQLKRRTDLVPNLVEIVKGYAGHERGLFEEIAQKRTSSICGRHESPARPPRKKPCRGRSAADGGGGSLSGAQGQPNFLELQNQFAEIEDQLQMARRYYNGAVRNLNISIQSFPNVLLARLLGFREEPFFELDDRSQAAAPQVTLPWGQAMTALLRIVFALAAVACGLCAGVRPGAHPQFHQRRDGRAQRRSRWSPRRSRYRPKGSEIRRGILRDFPTSYTPDRWRQGRDRLRSPVRHPRRQCGETAPPSA